MKKIQLFESFVETLNEAEKGLMHKLLEIPQDKKIGDVYKDGDKLASDLLRAVKNAKIVPVKDVRKKATSMLAFAGNWPNEGKNTVIDKALKSIKDTEIQGVPLK